MGPCTGNQALVDWIVSGWARRGLGRSVGGVGGGGGRERGSLYCGKRTLGRRGRRRPIRQSHALPTLIGPPPPPPPARYIPSAACFFSSSSCFSLSLLRLGNHRRLYIYCPGPLEPLLLDNLCPIRHTCFQSYTYIHKLDRSCLASIIIIIGTHRAVSLIESDPSALFHSIRSSLEIK